MKKQNNSINNRNAEQEKFSLFDTLVILNSEQLLLGDGREYKNTKA